MQLIPSQYTIDHRSEQALCHQHRNQWALFARFFVPAGPSFKKTFCVAGCIIFHLVSHEMLGVLIFCTALAAAPAAGSMLSPIILQNTLIKSPRIIYCNGLMRLNVGLAKIADAIAIQPELILRLRGGKKGTASQGKRGTGHKAHPSYKYNLRRVNNVLQILITSMAHLTPLQLSAKEQSRWNYLEAIYPQKKSTGF